MAAYGSQGDTRNGQENIPEGSIAHAIIDRLASDLNSDFSDLLSGISFPHTHVIGLCAHVIDQLAAKRTQSLDWNDISEQMGISINNCKAMWEHLRRPRTPPRRPEPRETFANNSIPTLASGPSLHDEGPLPPFSLPPNVNDKDLPSFAESVDGQPLARVRQQKRARQALLDFFDAVPSSTENLPSPSMSRSGSLLGRKDEDRHDSNTSPSREWGSNSWNSGPKRPLEDLSAIHSNKFQKLAHEEEDAIKRAEIHKSVDRLFRSVPLPRTQATPTVPTLPSISQSLLPRQPESAPVADKSDKRLIGRMFLNTLVNSMSDGGPHLPNPSPPASMGLLKSAPPSSQPSLNRRPPDGSHLQSLLVGKMGQKPEDNSLSHKKMAVLPPSTALKGLTSQPQPPTPQRAGMNELELLQSFVFTDSRGKLHNPPWMSEEDVALVLLVRARGMDWLGFQNHFKVPASDLQMRWQTILARLRDHLNPSIPSHSLPPVSHSELTSRLNSSSDPLARLHMQPLDPLSRLQTRQDSLRPSGSGLLPPPPSDLGMGLRDWPGDRQNNSGKLPSLLHSTGMANSLQSGRARFDQGPLLGSLRNGHPLS